MFNQGRCLLRETEFLNRHCLFYALSGKMNAVNGLNLKKGVPLKIDSGNVGMASARHYEACSRRTVSLISVSQTRLDGSASGKGKGLAANGKKEQSPQEALARFYSGSSSIRRAAESSARDEIDQTNRIRRQCIRFLLEIFLKDRRKETGAENTQSAEAPINDGVLVNNMKYSESSYYSEQETTSFSTTGKVVTSDGRELSFNLEMQMSRSFEAYYQRNYEQNVVVCDPLVINLDGNMAQVSDQKFLFDLDCDGEEENISFLGAGSGYLALDQNGDGKINDGSELFGTKSGDGFSDLMRYDEDGNGWIDENDEIFHKLVIWSKDESGRDVMYKLADKGVGAICLQNVSTDFALKSGVDNSTNALIRKTGIFLYENGNAGTVQHLDLAT